MKELDSEVYFVENIVPHLFEKGIKAEKYSVVLMKPSDSLKHYDYPSTVRDNNDEFTIVVTTFDKIEFIHEGQYVYYLNDRFTNASKDKIAKRNVYWNNLYRGKLNKKQTRQNDDTRISKKSDIFSYHINVGHGNCSIIVIKEPDKVRLWMVDCSDYDFTNHRNYSNNIDECLDFIREKFGEKNLKINKFFLTHPHFDHYSGMLRLINSRLIDGGTVFYLNTHYSMPSEKLRYILRQLHILGSVIIEPLTRQNNNVEILYPDIRTIRVNTPLYYGQVVRVQPKPNNASVVLQIKFNEKSMLFTGDIETQGWDIIPNCYPLLKNTSYYVVSHHGSINGHLRNVCPRPRNKVADVSQCAGRSTIQILMGRDHAFHGIYSPQVTGSFRNLIYSERNNAGNQCSFAEIDWQTDEVTHH